MFLIIASVFASSLSYSFLYISLPEMGLEPILTGYEPAVLAVILLWNCAAQESNLVSPAYEAGMVFRYTRPQCSVRDLNSQPPACKAGALPVELTGLTMRNMGLEPIKPSGYQPDALPVAPIPHNIPEAIRTLNIESVAQGFLH